MSEAIPGYYPPDFPGELARILPSAHTLDVRRLGKGGRVCKRMRLTIDGEQVTHAKRTDRDDDELAAELYQACEADAERHRGFGRYRITASFAKPPRGFAAEPQSVDVIVGEESDEHVESNAKRELFSELLVERKQMWEAHLSSVRETTKLASTVATMVIGLADAMAKVFDQQRNIAAESEDRAALRQQVEADRERMRTMERMAVPLFKQLMAGKAVAAEPAPSSAPAATAATLPPRVVEARELAWSMTLAQLELAKARFSTASRFLELRDAETDADVLGFVSWLLEQPTEDAMVVFDTLTERQAHLAANLQSWAVEQSAMDRDPELD